MTDGSKPRRLGPKRASKIRKLFNLTKDDDVRRFVIRREVASKKEGKKAKSKAPKIQRLVTPVTLQRKRRLVAIKKARVTHSKEAAFAYAKLVAKRKEEITGKSRASKAASRASKTTAAPTTKPAAALPTKPTTKATVAVKK